MLDLSKPVQTRDGKKVRIYATDGAGNLSIHGAVAQREGWCAHVWHSDGRNAYGPHDLINTPEPFHCELWLNVYPGSVGGVYESKSSADQFAGHSRIACKHVVLDGHVGDQQ